MIQKPDIFKTVLLGDGGVGKSSLRKSYLGKDFSYNYNMTIGADFSVKQYEIYGERVISQIWDLAGQPRFSNVREVYYKGSTGAILVFDKTRPETFKSIPKWINELLKNNNNKVLPMVLVGNKTDIERNFKNSVSYKTGVKYAKELSKWCGFKVPYHDTTALHSTDIDRVFLEVLQESKKQVVKEKEAEAKDLKKFKLRGTYKMRDTQKKKKRKRMFK